jgi:aspartate aminotransferase
MGVRTRRDESLLAGETQDVAKPVADPFEGTTPDPPTAPSVNLNLNVRGLSPSVTLAINELSQRLAAEGQQVFKLGLGQSPFPVPTPVVEALKANAHCKDYLAVRGLPALRKAVADYHCRAQGIDRRADDVLIGPGSKELMFLLQMVYYGDIVIPTPAWVSYAPQAQIIGRHVRWIRTTSTDRWLLQADDLDRLCRTDPDRPRIVVLNSPTNPTGQAYDRTALAQLAAVARKNRVIVLSDEIYAEIHHEGNHLSIAEFYPEGTIISSGLSKWCGAGGWRLGTFTFPEHLTWLLEAMAVVASETYTATSAPIQFAAVTAFQGGPGIERYLASCRRVLRALGRHSATVLQNAGVEVAPPMGAFYLFPDFNPLRLALRAKGIHTSAQLSEQLLVDTGVATIPGSSCGRPDSELTLRMAYVDFDGERALEAIADDDPDEELDEAFLHEHCPRVTEAMDRVTGWLGR